MGDGRFVGRVGALAVALGVGAAAATTPAVVWADTSDTSDAGTSATTSDSEGAAKTADETAESDQLDTAPDDAADGDAAVDGDDAAADEDSDAAGNDEESSTTDEIDSTPVTTDEPADETAPVIDTETDPVRPAGDETEAADSADALTHTVDNGGDGSQTSTTPASLRSAATATAPTDSPAESAGWRAATASENAITAAAEAAEPATPIITPVTTRPVAVAPPTPAAVLAGLPGAFISAATGLVALAVAPFAVLPGLFGVPGAPPPATGVWMVLAFARRQFFNSPPKLKPTPTSSDPATGLITGNLGGFDADGDEITFEVLRDPAHGTLTVDASTGAYTYTPAAGFAGADTFVVAVTDSGPDGLFGFLAPARGHTTVTAVTITVPQLDLDPSFTVATVDAKTGAVTGRITGTEIGRPGVTATVSGGPTRGTATLAPDGTVTYTPAPIARAAAAYAGGATTDTFTVTVSDGVNAPVVVSISVPIDATDNALVYQVPVNLGQAQGGSFYRFERPFALDPKTGRVYAAEIFVDRDNAQNGLSPTYATIISAGPDGLIRSERVQIQNASPIAINPVSGVAFLVTTSSDSTGATFTSVTRLTADGRTISDTFLGAPATTIDFDGRTGAAFLVRPAVSAADLGSTRLDVFAADGTFLVTRTIPGTPHGGLAVNSITGQRVLVTQGLDSATFQPTTNLTVIRGDGTIITHTVDGQPIRDAVVNPVTGITYQLSQIRQGAARATVLTGIDPDGNGVELLRYNGSVVGDVVVDTASGAAYVPVSALPAPGSPPVVTVLRVATDATVNQVFEGPGFVEGNLAVNPRSGAVHLVVAAPGSQSRSVVTIADRAARTELLPDGVTGPIIVNPSGSSVFVTSAVGDVTSISVVDSSGTVHTLTGRLVGEPVVDPSDGTTYVTTRTGTFVDGTATLTTFCGDGIPGMSYDLAGFPTNPPVINPVTGVVYQEVIDFGATTESPGRVTVISRDGARGTLQLRNASGIFAAGAGQGRYVIAPNTVTGQAYLVIERGFPEQPVKTVAVISADGSAVSYVGPDDGDAGPVGVPVGPILINPRTGAAYLTTQSFEPDGIKTRVSTLLQDGTVRFTDALPGGTVAGGLLVDSRIGTVYQGTSDGAWIVDVDPNSNEA
ncbi:Ig-like domain-containing protein [Mycolicibacterium iranicum]|uniref:Ig-like domain-containing protein n=1 Tax=Mycolicibacterium iranicum TaxID=912594 RepID=UPI001055D0E9|nr:Ig-like domain-containing protein [Mycolicibacterium iranicum]